MSRARSAGSSKELLIYLNGRFVPKSRALVSVFDHGFLYGDGVFEGIAVYEGKAFRLEEHITRFFDSAKAIDLQIPLDGKKVAGAIIETIRRNAIVDGYVRPIVTRGEGALGLNPAYCKKATFVIIPQHAADYPLMHLSGRPARAIVSTIRRNPSFCVPASAKTLNYLNNILAKQQATAAGLEEAIMLDWTGLLSEGTADNLFIVKRGSVSTPSLHCSILPGVTRTAVLDACKEAGIATREEELTLQDLYTADEAFLTSTSLEIQPLVEVDGREIGKGVEGPVTRRVKKGFGKIKSEGR
ncbi:MAG: branched-chain-amino-acid transaminase [Thaumarchaeota archaeon]|nr:branched-chain-amino-acid transaminase [Nitrososphaerota archaeon]